VSARRDAPLQVVRFVATRPGDPDRGPLVRLNAAEAAQRLLVDGELVYVIGPKRRELVPLVVDDTVRRGEVHARDIAGILLTDIVRVVKPDLDRGPTVKV
jgi:hypothetical protein